jgi:hypothetical protein
MNAIKSMNLWANQLSHEPLPVKRQTLPAGQSAVWKYKGIYLQADQHVGQKSDVVSIPVAG